MDTVDTAVDTVSHTPPLTCREKVPVPLNAGGTFLVPGYVRLRGSVYEPPAGSLAGATGRTGSIG
jgi:hypothetical protein